MKDATVAGRFAVAWGMKRKPLKLKNELIRHLTLEKLTKAAGGDGDAQGSLDCTCNQTSCHVAAISIEGTGCP